ncbi:hypothetical protein AB0E01_17090 [Nocardia vinacea]|uniref:hypothetical protein n=1 Tax=Nocardia vinacea TaxID=96468 RepID=UPI0033C704D9
MTRIAGDELGVLGLGHTEFGSQTAIPSTRVDSRSPRKSERWLIDCLARVLLADSDDGHTGRLL